MSKASTRHWFWYGLSYLVAFFIAADCAINAIYYMGLQHYTLPIIALAAISGFLLNKLLYATDAPSQLSALIKPSELIGDKNASLSKRMVVIASNLIAMGSGVAMGAFTMTSYLNLMPHLPALTLGFAIICSLAYAAGTYTLLRGALVHKLMGSPIDEDGFGSTGWWQGHNHTLRRFIHWVQTGYSLEHTQRKRVTYESRCSPHPALPFDESSEYPKRRGWALRLLIIAVAWLLAMGAVALTLEQWGIGTLSFFQNTLGIPGTWALGITVAVMGLLAVGELVFNSAAVVDVASSLTAPSLRWDGLDPRKHPIRWTVGLVAIGAIAWNAWGNGAIASGAGFLSSHLPLIVCALLGALLSGCVMTKAVIDAKQESDGALPFTTQGTIDRPRTAKATAMAVTGLSALAVCLGGEHLLAGHALPSWLLPTLPTLGQWGPMILMALSISVLAWGIASTLGAPSEAPAPQDRADEASSRMGAGKPVPVSASEPGMMRGTRKDDVHGQHTFVIGQT